MNTYTPEQRKAIQGWTEKRDILLREIGIYSTELNELKSSTKNEGLALADLHKSIADARGRLAEMAALEERWKGSISTEIAELIERKSRLEGECAVKETEVKEAKDKIVVVTVATGALQSAHDTMKDQAAIVNRVVGEIIQTSQTHTSEMKTMMTEVRAISDEVISKGNKNVEQTGIILEKLPRYIFELQKPIPIRRAYATPKGTIIQPEKKDV